MAKLIDKFWNWGHLERSHNDCTGLICSMTPEEFSEVYGIQNAFMVSYGGNITPPFDAMAQRFSGLREIKWSVLGDASTPLPEDELGHTNDILAVLPDAKNITGAVVDDFFSPERMVRFTPEVLLKIKNKLNANGLDFWCVLYDNQLDLDLTPYMDCFDGVTFWIWESKNIASMEESLSKLFAITKDKPVMLGIYLWDYSEEANRPMPADLFEKQLTHYGALLMQKKIDGIVVCASTIGDAPLKTNAVLKAYLTEYGNTEMK